MLFKQRDKQIFERIFDAYAKSLYNFLLAKTFLDHAVTEELLNETFISALQSASKIKTKENLKSWFFKIAHRRLNDYQKSLYSQKIVPLDSVAATLPDGQESIDATIIRKEKVAVFEIAMEKINPEYKNLLILKYDQKMKIKEIARRMNKTETAIVSMINRAKEALKRELRKQSPDFFAD